MPSSVTILCQIKSKGQDGGFIIIDEISMVSPYLLDFINQMFCELCNCAQPFGGIMVLLIGDIVQLPPVGAPFVITSASWNLFMPLILSTSKRHSSFRP